MRLHNQSGNALSWDMGGVAYSCEPWGSLDVPEDLVTAALARGLPLNAVRVAPEIREQERIAAERRTSDAEPLRVLQAAADEARALEQAARLELEAAQERAAELNAALAAAERDNARLREANASLEADKSAAEKLLSESAKQIADAESRALRAETMLREKPKPEKQKPAQA